ncbi:MAG: CheR family methyltransferase [Fervidobacterium gondwanense]|uniref:protein-glutamate O-methyltransferase n=1 Tax=Fervidobacterium gondwanense DSM 13020 TaxID=1121883 RepID=A0A1M7T7L6_FERGO|nr:protein-glutamate O-methyltransferase CheR [Fervidobacterium gondwanense]SHN66720.1 chemotaxis protein methyltransferase CheR [Fervidobacterium gondwanense DSM 13020]
MSLDDFKEKKFAWMSNFQSGDIPELPWDQFEWFVGKIKETMGLDLSGYKPERMKRRIEMLIRKYNCKSYKEYFDLIMKDNKKKDEFLDKLTINVTEFFRNPEKWEELKKTFLPELLKESGARFKAWSAGCSSGEEPYSLAILLEELKAPLTAKVLATDIDMGVLTRAQIGEYEERSMVSTPLEYIQKYFIVRDGKYVVKPNVKARVQFKRHNLLQDPFEKGLDMIMCRNVVIYFEMEAKDQLYRRFAESLRPGGILFVGNTERIFNYRNLGLEVASPFIYRKI